MLHGAISRCVTHEPHEVDGQLELEHDMKKILLAAAALVMIAAPALAQSYNPDSAAYASQRSKRIQSSHAGPNRARAVQPRAPYGAYARSPGFTNGYSGYRWPGARYDEYGYYIDPNSPGRH
jgi:opacity protein-like surface antigen